MTAWKIAILPEVQREVQHEEALPGDQGPEGQGASLRVEAPSADEAVARKILAAVAPQVEAALLGARQEGLLEVLAEEEVLRLAAGLRQTFWFVESEPLYKRQGKKQKQKQVKKDAYI